MLDAVEQATEDLDATVLYVTTVRPFDADGLRAAMTGADVVFVEPYLAGTSAADVSASLLSQPHRLLSIGVPPTEHRKYGTPAQHNEAHGLDAQGIRNRIVGWLDHNAATQADRSPR